ncbi:MAG: 3-hydroxyacyl-CoA dehydrogenase family protein [Clostridia bacterium]|nr:3-hydroxyacyl-CoA dehydrogenase family protein [Clostridia bacterium]
MALGEDELAVVGTGTMGASIAALALASGFQVRVWTRGPEAAARTRVGQVLARYRPEAGGAIERLRVVPSPRDLRPARAVIEAVPEDPALKRRVFAELDLALAPDAFLFSNTSVLGPEIFALVADERLPRTAILHFFHPVFRMELVEVNVHAATSEETARAGEAIARRLGREPLRVRGVPGGVVSRVVLAAINEAARLLDAGGLRPEDVDRALVLGAHYPLGPLALADLVGLDVVLDNLRALAVHEGPAFQPAPALERLVGEGRLGKKSGRGFFDYGREVARRHG